MTTEQQRKMLEAAAKACGYGELIFCNGADDDGYDNGVWKYTWRRDELGRLLLWNPITNALDTADMCAKLKIATTWGITYDFVDCSVGLFASSNETRAWFKDHDNSRLKSWMHAATMVCARIGGYKNDY